MFGQDPKLPVDLLLGRLADPVLFTVNDWILEHQTRLYLAFEGAKGHQAAAADKRQQYHADRVRDLPLQEGQLVYVHEHGGRGCHKIQDLWNLTLHKV